MRRAFHFIVAVAAALGLTACGSIEDVNRGVMGVASPAVAMFASQSSAALSMCAFEGHLPDLEAAEKFAGWARDQRQMQADPAYVSAYLGYRQTSDAKYAAAAGQMSASEKAAFCAEFVRDIAVRRFASYGHQSAFTTYFSPPTQEYQDRLRKRQGALVVIGALGTAAGLNQMGNGNLTAGQDIFAASNAVMGAIPAQQAALPCAAYAPFTRSSAPAGDAVWRRYHSIRVC